MESHYGSTQGIEMFGTPDSQVYDAGPSSGEEEQSRSFFVRALYDFTSDDASSLSFEKGAIIEVLTQLESGWWDGLLGINTRGWFPSNYVEVISDEEAEMELLARDGEAQVLASGAHDDVTLSTRRRSREGTKDNDFGGLGLGQDFDVLRQLMAGQSPLMANDAFEQLAEAGMRDSTTENSRTSKASTLQSSRQPPSSTRTRISDTSFADSNHTDFISITPRSNGNSSEGSKAASAAASASNSTSALRPGRSEKERMRANTLETGPSSQPHSIENRPRSATDAGPARRSSQRQRRENDFWVPRVSERGDIYYLNTRTGEHAVDLPSGTEAETVAKQGQSSATTSEDDGGNDSSRSDHSVVRSLKSAPRKPLFGRHTSTIYAESEEGRSRAASESRPSTSTSHQAPSPAASSKARSKNAIEFMPDPREVAFPWVPRASDDEKTYHYYNRQTHEISLDPPTLSVEDADERYDSTEEILDMPRQGPRKSRATTLSSSERSLFVPREDDVDAGPLSRHADERAALELQHTMKTRSPPLQSYLDEASQAIGQLAAIASETVASDGLSDQDRRNMVPSSSTLAESSRLGLAIRNVVDSVRSLLYSAGSLAVSPTDLSTVSELAWLVQESASTDVLTAFQGTMLALHGRGAPEMGPHVAVALQQALASPPTALTSLGKKINATLSKLVLSARSVIEQSCLNISIRPELSTSQLEKIASYRQRIRDDSMELSRALVTFGIEAHRAGSVPWTRDVHGVLKSAAGVAGIGTSSLGGGAAAGWRANGFVLPTATEAAALRAEASGSYLNPFELTKDARNALSSGKISLRRKPTQTLSQQTMERLARHFDQLSEEVSRYIGSEECITPETIISEVKPVLAEVGTLLVAIEDIDLATSLDVDGVLVETMSRSGSEEYAGLVVQARDHIHDFASVKQEMYDLSSIVLMEAQDAVSEAKLSDRRGSDTATEAEQIMMISLADLDRAAKQLKKILVELVDIANEQAQSGIGQIGARAKVYGVDDVKLSAPAYKADRSGGGADMDRSLSAEIGSMGEELTDDVMYLGPGLAVPNGPPPGSAPAASIKTMSTNGGLRGRSTSVTTGASVNSNDSLARSVRKDDVNNKIKRFFGDEPTMVTSNRDASGETSSLSSTYVKPVEVETPWFLEVDYSAEDIVFNVQGQVKGATLSALMERLTMHNSFDANFNTTFLMTYRSFTTTEELLDLLAARFRVKEPAGLTEKEHQTWVDQKQMLIRFRIFNVLKAWIESHFYEGEDEVHLKRIEDFVLDGMGQSPILATPGKQLIRLIERRSGKGDQMVRKFQLPASTPAPILPKNFRKIKFLDIDPLEMARQLTLIDSRLYNRIRPVECLAKAWSRENGAEVAKGIRDVINANNKVSGWVSEAILVQEDLKKRAAWVKQFVAIADRCYALNNFSSMMAIYSGLNNASLNRLRRTWDAVNQRHLQMFENMKNILAPTKNFSKYRETLRQLNPPCVPFLGVYLTDLTFIEDGNSDRLKTDERLINFSKRQMTADKIQEIMIYQSTPYNLTPVASIQKFIEENLIESRRDEELFDQSLRLEPREREDEKIARLLQESGFL
jgi:son of sevenless-like protein